MPSTAKEGKRQYRMGARARRMEETRGRILAVALDRFLSRPYDDVTLAEIGENADVAIATLLSHFGRKEDLFAAAVEAWGAQMVELRDEAPVDDHAAAVRKLFDQYEANGSFILHLLAEEDRFSIVREMTDAGRRYHREWVERVFRPSLGSHRAAEREQLVVQLIVATDLLVWKLMRIDLKLSRRKAEAAILRTVDTLTGRD